MYARGYYAVRIDTSAVKISQMITDHTQVIVVFKVGFCLAYISILSVIKCF